MALSGTLDTFALPDVLRLLATTAKTGRLRISGPRGSGSVWVDGGEVVATELTSVNALDPTDVEVVFGLLRFEAGSFTFENDATAPNAASGSAMEPLLGAAENMLAEWRSIEEIVPSLDVWVALSAELQGPDVMVDAQRWRCIAIVGSGVPVSVVAEGLHLNEVDSCRLVKELIELGLIEKIDAPADALETEPSFPDEIDAEDSMAVAETDDSSADEAAHVPHAADDFDHDTDHETEVGDIAAADGTQIEPEIEAEIDGEFEAGDTDHHDHDHGDDDGLSFIDNRFAEPSTVPSLASLTPSDAVMNGDAENGTDAGGSMFDGATEAEAEADDLNPAEMARQLANLSPKAAKAVAAAAKATTDAERDAALAAVEAEDGSVNRGLLLKFLGSVDS